MTSSPPFRLALPVHDLEAAKDFYLHVLGCPQGRCSKDRLHFNFFGNQIVAHLVAARSLPVGFSRVDGKPVPVPHFGVVLSILDWEALVKRLLGNQVTFAIRPQVRFKGEVGEQATMLLFDPSDNAIEFKGMRDVAELFSS